MIAPQKGISCAGCPHRAAYVVCKDVLGRKRGRVICGDAGCRAVGPMHPAATACPGGQEMLLPRYNHPVPAGTPEEPGSDVCVHFALDEDVAKSARNVAAEVDDAVGAAGDAGATSASAGSPYAASVLAGEGACAVLAVLASSRGFLAHEEVEELGRTLLRLGYADVTVLNPFDTLRCGEVLKAMIEEAGVHAVVFASPCAQLTREQPLEHDEVDQYTCVGCQRCIQIVGCPALTFRPPTAFIDPNVCSGCDLCGDYCRTHVILSPRGHLSPEQRAAERLAAALKK